MAGFILGAMRRGLAEAGGVAEVAGIKALQSALDEQRMTRLEELRAASAERLQGKDQEFRAGEAEKGREFTAGESEKGRTFQSGEAEKGRTFQSSEAEKGRTFQSSEAEKGRTFQASEKDKDRQLDSRRLDIQARQVDATVRAAGIAAEKGEIEVKSLKRVQALHDAYLNETDPAKREQIADQIYTLAGKDKYTPLVGKDDMGNPAFLGAFNTRSGERKTGAPSGSGVDWSQFVGGGDKAAPGPTKARAGNIASRMEVPPETPGVNAPLPRTTAEPALSKVQQIERALKTPNLTTQQKAALSLQLQEAMREEGTLGQ